MTPILSRPVIEMAPPPPATEPVRPPAAEEPSPVRAVRKAQKFASKPGKAVAKSKPVEPVIPLVHAPDDPGPDSGLDVDPVPEPSTPPTRDAWQRIRQLFR